MNSRNTKSYDTSPDFQFKSHYWASRQETFLWTNGNDHYTLHDPFPKRLFVGKMDFINGSKNSFQKLDQLLKQKDWIYGFFSYELKNEIEALSSTNPATIPCDHISFIIPETILIFTEHQVEIISIHDPDAIYDQIQITTSIAGACHEPSTVALSKSRTTKTRYIDHIKKIKNCIVEGDFYEMNYCLEYIAKSRDFDPIHCYHRLNSISPMPFSVLMKMDQLFLASASPERFLKKVGQKIISQPIKGTIRRSFDGAEDERLKLELLNSEKERSENLMIVDLVRNDLARTALTGTVKVEELFGIYTFRRLHQMISTVVSTVDESTSLTEIIRCAFPMGSMTGAPKIRVMEEIDLLEDTRRGLFSGAVGFFTPEGDFDFNVVIRSIVYDRNLGNISFHVGSAITYDSIPEREYNECLLKAEAIFEVLKQ